MKFKTVFNISMLMLLLIIGSAFKNYNPVEELMLHKTIVNNGNESFAKFLSKFEKIDMPVKIDLDHLHQSKAQQVVSKVKEVSIKSFLRGKRLKQTSFIPELMSILKFSRRSPPIYEAVARFYPNGEKGKSVAVIYSASSPFSSEYKTYYLMVYDLKGNVIFPTKDPKHDRLLGGFHIASNEVKNSTSCEISQDGLITIKNYENEWEKDYNNFGAADNRIVGHTLIDQKIYQFDDRGMAVEQSVNKPDALAAMK